MYLIYTTIGGNWYFRQGLELCWTKDRSEATRYETVLDGIQGIKDAGLRYSKSIHQFTWVNATNAEEYKHVAKLSMNKV